jgi:Transport protein particle (TRAPP) component
MPGSVFLPEHRTENSYTTTTSELSPGSKRGYNIGVRLIEDFLARAGTGRCADFRQVGEVVSKVRHRKCVSSLPFLHVLCINKEGAEPKKIGHTQTTRSVSKRSSTLLQPSSIRQHLHHYLPPIPRPLLRLPLTRIHWPNL